MSGHLAVWLSGCLAVWLSGCLAVWLSGCLAVWLSVWLRARTTAAAAGGSGRRAAQAGHAEPDTEARANAGRSLRYRSVPHELGLWDLEASLTVPRSPWNRSGRERKPKFKGTKSLNMSMDMSLSHVYFGSRLFSACLQLSPSSWPLGKELCVRWVLRDNTKSACMPTSVSTHPLRNFVPSTYTPAAPTEIRLHGVARRTFWDCQMAIPSMSTACDTLVPCNWSHLRGTAN